MTASTFAPGGDTVNDHTTAADAQVAILVEGSLGSGKIKMLFRNALSTFSPLGNNPGATNPAPDGVFSGSGVMIVTLPVGTVIRPQRDGGQQAMAATVTVLDMAPAVT